MIATHPQTPRTSRTLDLDLRVQCLSQVAIPDLMKKRVYLSISLVSAVGLAWVFASSRCSREPSARVELVEALEGMAAVDGWLGGWQRPPVTASSARPARLALRRAVQRIKGSDLAAPDLLAVALIQIADEKWDQALSSLKTRVVQADLDARASNDLAVLYLTLAARKREPRLLLSAFASIDRALEIDRELPEAAFNRALILERLYLQKKATSAWRKFLNAHPSSLWAVEARRHLAALEQAEGRSWKTSRAALQAAVAREDLARVRAIVRRFTSEARVYVEETVLPGWALAIRRGDLAAAERLGRDAEVIADCLQGLTGDRLPYEAAMALRQATGPRRDRLVRGHLAFAQGYAAYKDDRIGEARPLLAAARGDLAQAGSPFGDWADFFLTACDFRDELSEAALRKAAAVEEVAERKSYLNVAGRWAWLQGLIRMERAEPQAALEPLLRSLSLFQRTREKGYQSWIYAILANGHESLGEPEQAWTYQYRALELTAGIGDPALYPVIYGAAARALARQRQGGIALEYQDEVIDMAFASHSPLTIAEALWARATIWQQLGEARRAAQDVGLAHSYCTRISHEPTRLRTLAGISAAQGAILRTLDPRRGIEVLDRALTLYEQIDFTYPIADIYLDRARCALGAGAYEQAESDLRAGIAEYERQRWRIEAPELRVSFFERARDVFDEMIAFQIDRRRDLDAAFGVVERSRARTLLDLLAPDNSERRSRQAATVSAADLRRRLPAGTVLVQYSVLDERLLVWAFWKDGGSFAQQAVGRPALADLVTSLLRATRRPASSPALERSGSQLFDLLLARVLAQAPQHARLVLVPDKDLLALPFACLWNPRTRRFLVQDHPWSVAPSASIYLRALERASRAPRGRCTTALGIGDPSFDRAEYPQLVSLPDAKAEAAEVAARWPGSLTLLGEEATATEVLARLNGFDLVHYSGHAVVDRANPSRSRLVLARDGRGARDLTSGDIYDLRLTRPRLIVLSACSTAAGRRANLEGASSLAIPFLAAGAPAVLATLWNVNDQGSRDFFALFYGEIERGADPVLALQRAQKVMIESTATTLNRPAAWAGYQLIGAASPAAIDPKGDCHGETVRDHGGPLRGGAPEKGSVDGGGADAEAGSGGRHPRAPDPASQNRHP